VESLAQHLGAPSAAYWMIGLRDVPMRYRVNSTIPSLSTST
jgi:hypothetical protein